MTTRRTKVATALATAALACGGLGVIAGPANAATADSTAPSTAASRAAACDRAPWGDRVQGEPKNFGAGDHGGDYLWHDTHGFHLRVTHGKHDQRVYSGEVTSSSPMKIDPVKLEKGDTLKESANHRSFVFVFSNHGYIDGVNFHTDCANTLEVSRLHVGNRDLPRDEVYLGYTKAHPSAIPFRVHRYHG